MTAPAPSATCAWNDGTAERTNRALLALAPGSQAFLASDEQLLRDIGWIVRRGLWQQSPVGQIAADVAEKIFDFAIAHGAGLTGVWIYGPRAFYREASIFVRAWGSL